MSAIHEADVKVLLGEIDALVLRERVRTQATGASNEKGFRIRAAVVWTAAALLVLGAHAACAVAFLSWRAADPTTGEPPAAIMIDLPANATGLADRPRAMRGIGDRQDQHEAAADSIPLVSPAVAVSDDQAQQGARPSAIMAQSVALPPAAAATAHPHVAKSRKPQKRVQKPVKRQHHPATARPPVLSPTGATQTSAAAPAARRATATAGAAVTAADIPSTWKSALLAQLERYKRYPEAARGTREEGTTLLSFTIDRDGRVLESFVVHSSGFAPLDDETLAMLRRAAPLPKIPPDVPGDSLQLVVPVHFSTE